MAVAQQLNLDVARLFDKLLNEHAVIAKAVFGFVAARSKTVKRLLVIEGNPQAFAAAKRMVGMGVVGLSTLRSAPPRLEPQKLTWSGNSG